MKNIYKLSQSGIERLKRFKRDIEAGDFKAREERASQSDIDPMYFVVSSENGTNCAWTKDASKVVELTLQDIDTALSNPVEKRLHDCGSVFYCSTSGSAPGLNRSDITTPAQRALEALGKKLQERSAVWD